LGIVFAYFPKNKKKQKKRKKCRKKPKKRKKPEKTKPASSRPSPFFSFMHVYLRFYIWVNQFDWQNIKILSTFFDLWSEVVKKIELKYFPLKRN